MRRQFRVYSSALPGMNTALDPRDSRPPLFDALIATEVSWQADRVELPKVLIEFDVSLLDDPQLEAASQLLKHRRRYWLRKTGQPPTRKPTRLHTGLFGRYLRMLDFNAIRMPPEQLERLIGRSLFPDDSGEKLRDLIRTNFTAARQRQDDYLLVAMHPARS
jgi:hypothetical protein